MPGNRRAQLAQRLQGKEYRDAIVAAENSNAIAFQIKAMQADRGWTQEELGNVAGMKQAFISRIVNSTSGNYSLATLRKLASAFDVALIVRFAPFNELVDWMVNLTPQRLAPPSFDKDLSLGLTGVPATSASLGTQANESAIVSHGIMNSTESPDAALIVNLESERQRRREEGVDEKLDAAVAGEQGRSNEYEYAVV